MEACVKRINPNTSLEEVLAPWNKIAVCLRGHKYATCVINDDTALRLVKVRVADFDRYAGNVHPENSDPKTVAEKWMAFTYRAICPKEITQGAARILRMIIDGEIPAEDVELNDVELAPSRPEGVNHGTDVSRRKKKPRLVRKNGEDTTTTAAPKSTILAGICATLKLEPTIARRMLRAAGMSAPYDDEKKILSVLKA